MIEEFNKTRASKLWFSMVVVFVLLLNVSYVEAKSLKKGEEFKGEHGGAIRVVSSDEVEIEQGPDILLGKYTIDGERVRIVINALGTAMVRYYKIIPDGLKEEKGGTVYYSNAGVVAKKERWILEQQRAAEEEANADTFYNAVSKGNVERVKMFLAKGADVNAKDADGNTVLGSAINYPAEFPNNIAIIKMLLAKGADVNAKTYYSEAIGYFSTILIDAVNSADNKTEIVKMLLEKGADVRIKNSQGKTAFDYAKNPKILEMLNKYAAQKKK